MAELQEPSHYQVFRRNSLQDLKDAELNCPYSTRDGTEKNNNNDALGQTRNEDYECKRLELLTMLKANFDELPKDIENWHFNQIRQWILNEACEISDIPRSLVYLIPGVVLPGDAKDFNLPKPKWYDEDLFHRGQKFAQENFAGLCFAKVISLCVSYGDEDTLKPLILSGGSSTPYQAFKRYLGTINHVRTWYREDPWREGSPAYKSMRAVRRMHLAMRKRLCQTTNEKINADSIIADPWSSIQEILVDDISAACPVLSSSIYKLRRNEEYRPKAINQADMSLTQFAFVGLALLNPPAFAIHRASEMDLEGFCHMWRCFGYLLGIEDEYNFCNGSLNEIRERSRSVVETIIKPNLRNINPTWEHMCRCMTEGIRYFFVLPSFEVLLLYATDLLKIPTPRLVNYVSYGTQLKVLITKWLIYYVLKIPGVVRHANAHTNNAIDRGIAFSSKKHSLLEAKSTKKLMEFTLG